MVAILCSHARVQKHGFLSLLGQPPGQLTVEEVAWVLNCAALDVPVLVAAKLLKPFRNPPQNGTKLFATQEVLEATKDGKWLRRVTPANYQHWHKRNARVKEHREYELTNSSCLAP